MHGFGVSEFGVSWLRLLHFTVAGFECGLRRNLGLMNVFVAGVLITTHQIGRSSDLRVVRGIELDFELAGLADLELVRLVYGGVTRRKFGKVDFVCAELVSIDFGNFRLGFSLRLPGAFEGGTQGIEYLSISGQRFELFDSSASLVGHEVLEVEAHFFDRLGNLGIVGGMVTGMTAGSGDWRDWRRLVDGERILPLGG